MYDFSGDFATFYTGETDISLSGLYDTFRGSPNLPQWNGEHCSNIRNASDGTKFKSFIKDDEELLFFRKSMCRPQRLVSYMTCVARTFNSTRAYERNYSHFEISVKEESSKRFIIFLFIWLAQTSTYTWNELSAGWKKWKKKNIAWQPVRQDYSRMRELVTLAFGVCSRVEWCCVRIARAIFLRLHRALSMLTSSAEIAIFSLSIDHTTTQREKRCWKNAGNVQHSSSEWIRY